MNILWLEALEKRQNQNLQLPPHCVAKYVEALQACFAGGIYSKNPPAG